MTVNKVKQRRIRPQSIKVDAEVYKALIRKQGEIQFKTGEKITLSELILLLLGEEKTTGEIPREEKKHAEISSTSDVFSEPDQSADRSEKRAIRRKYASAAGRKKFPADSEYLIEKTKQKLKEGVEDQAILRGLRFMGLDEEEAEAVLEAAKEELGK